MEVVCRASHPKFLLINTGSFLYLDRLLSFYLSTLFSSLYLGLVLDELSVENSLIYF
jgi:hypothetical protein